MPVLPLILVLALAYLIGSIPSGYLLVRFVRREDIREVGSGNIGATNVVRSGAKGLGALTFVLDSLKGYVAVKLAQSLLALSLLHSPVAVNWTGSLQLHLEQVGSVAAIAALLGHIYPVWLGFKGGKGVATAWGIFMAIVPIPGLIAISIFALLCVTTRYVSVASIAGSLAVPIAALLLPHPPRSAWVLAVLLLRPGIVIGQHYPYIRRLLNGTEFRFGTSKQRSPEAAA